MVDIDITYNKVIQEVAVLSNVIDMIYLSASDSLFALAFSIGEI